MDDKNKKTETPKEEETLTPQTPTEESAALESSEIREEAAPSEHPDQAEKLPTQTPADPEKETPEEKAEITPAEESEADQTKPSSKNPQIQPESQPEAASEKPEEPQVDPEKALKAQKRKERMEKIKVALIRSLRIPWTYLLLAVAAGLLFLLYRLAQTGLIKVSLVGLVLGIGLIVLALAGYVFFYARDNRWKIPGVLLCTAAVLVCMLGQGYASMVSKGLGMLSIRPTDLTRSAAIYCPSLAPVSSLDALNNETIGIMGNENDPLNQMILSDLSEKGIHVKTKSYPSLASLYKAVKGQAIRAVILDGSDYSILGNLGIIDQKTGQLSVLYSKTFDTGIRLEANDINLEKDPFTVLISASRSPLKEQGYSSTLNVLATVNPSSRQILLTILPRTLFVPSACDQNLGCSADQASDRLGFAGYQTSEGLRQTLANLTGTPVDFVVRLDLDSLSRLYDLSSKYTLRPDRDVFNTNDQSEDEVMNSPKVRQFLGTLNHYSSDDFNQELNQLRLLADVWTQLPEWIHSQMPETLEILDDSIQTSFSYSQLCELVRLFFLLPMPMTIQVQAITGTQSVEYSPALTESAFVLHLDQPSMDAAKAAIQETLAGNQPTVQVPAVPLPQPEENPPVSEEPAASEQPAEPVEDQQQEVMDDGTDYGYYDDGYYEDDYYDEEYDPQQDWEEQTE